MQSTCVIHFACMLHLLCCNSIQGKHCTCFSHLYLLHIILEELFFFATIEKACSREMTGKEGRTCVLEYLMAKTLFTLPK